MANWREGFLAKLDELSLLEILTYQASNTHALERLFADELVLEYLVRRLKKADPSNDYQIKNYHDFYSVAMCLLHPQQDLSLLVYAISTNKDAYWQAHLDILSEAEKEHLLAVAIYAQNEKAIALLR